MKYGDLRSTIKSGDVIAWSEKGSWKFGEIIKSIELNIVRMFTESEYNHIGVVYVVGGRVLIVEAVVPAVQISQLSDRTPFYYIRTPDGWWTSNTEKTLLARVGMPYSKLEAIRAFFTKDTQGNYTWECAKLVNKTLMEFDPGFEQLHDTPTATVKYLLDKHSLPLVYIE
jgi:hypothetical protein